MDNKKETVFDKLKSINSDISTKIKVSEKVIKNNYFEYLTSYKYWNNILK